MRPQRALGGIPKRSNGAVKRLWSDVLIGQFKALDAAAGNGVVTVHYTILGNNRQPASIVNDVVTYTGILGTVMRPNYDAMKAEPAYLTIEFGADGELS